MRRYRVTERARREIQDIGRYTEKHWGRILRDRFLRALAERMNWLADNTGTGRSRDDIELVLKCYPHSIYMIYYLLDANGIEIVGIKHTAQSEKMWWLNRR